MPRVENSLFAPVWTADITGQVPGLTSFHLEFTNGDHHVAWIWVGTRLVPARPDFWLALTDGDQGVLGREHMDPARMWADYMNLAGYGAELRTVGLDHLRGTRAIAVPVVPPERVALLSGFQFKTRSGNHHLRRLRLWPRPALGRTSVGFQDNDGEDSYDFFYVYADVARQPLPGHPTFLGPFEEQFEFVGSTSVPRRLGVALLHGFSFEYLDTDHHLLRVAVDLQANDRTIEVSFVDSEGNHRVRAMVSYVLFRQ